MSDVRVVLMRMTNLGLVIEDVTCAECAKFGPFSDRAGWCSYWMSSTVGKTPCAAWSPRHEVWEPRPAVGIGDDEGTP